MAAVAEKPYGDLLKTYEPSVIRTKADNEHALKVLATILAKGEANLDEHELRFVQLLSTLISEFERNAYRIEGATPADILRELMRARNMSPRDLIPVFGSKGLTSEVLRGKRGISKEKAKILAEMFCVSAELFI